MMTTNGALQAIASKLEIEGFDANDGQYLMWLVRKIEEHITDMVPVEEHEEVRLKLLSVESELEEANRMLEEVKNANKSLVLKDEAERRREAERLAISWMEEEHYAESSNPHPLAVEFWSRIRTAEAKASEAERFALEVQREAESAQLRVKHHINMQSEKISKLTREMASREIREDAPHLEELLQEERERVLADVAAIAEVHGASDLSRSLKGEAPLSLPAFEPSPEFGAQGVNNSAIGSVVMEILTGEKK